ncbi:MAG: NHL repeat protein [Lentisphaerae bacterium ADurb.BinA184]|nr:MAG: NHL repeat protein [Lentisphaerae bacterium ADurb.BinA184]
MKRLAFLASAFAAVALHANPAPLRVVGVLGNTSGLDAPPVPYAFYTGIAADRHGRLYLAGARQGLPVCDQDGRCLAVLRTPQTVTAPVASLLIRSGDHIFGIAADPARSASALCRIATASPDVAQLAVEAVADGPGLWALSPTPDADGRVIIGKSFPDRGAYEVAALDPAGGPPQTLFILDMPAGATRPWRHLVQADPDGGVSIQHAGGVNWSGRYRLAAGDDAPAGARVGEAADGQILDGQRYCFGYEGGLRRLGLDGVTPAPGDCGSPAGEIRMAAQVARIGERFFFAGRGGALEARWTGTNFLYTRRLGGVCVEDLCDDGMALRGIAFTTSGNQDVQHPIVLPKAQPIGQLLQVEGPAHGRHLVALVAAPEGQVAAHQARDGIHLAYLGGARHLDFDVPLPGVQGVGQLARLGNDVLLADPASGTLWRRPLLDKAAAAVAWRTGLPGVTGLAVAGETVFAATPTQVVRLSPDGQAAAWETPPQWQGIRRLAATPEHVYVCDTAAHVVAQLDAATGALLARLGAPGDPGAALDRLDRPWAVAADLNAVYIADAGNGRIVVATTTLWRPDIQPLPREDDAPIVAARIPLSPPAGDRMSVNVYDRDHVTVRQLACAVPVSGEVLWDGRDQYGRWAAPGVYTYHGIVPPKLSLRYVTSVGQSGNPPYRTADGRGSWGGVWGDVMDICPIDPAAADTDIAVLWAFEEGEGGLIRMSPDGQVRWKQHLDWWMKASQMAVASDGNSLYIVAASAMNAPEGQANYQGKWNRPMLWRVEAATGAKQLYAARQADQPMFGEYKDSGRIVTDVAVRDGRLYLTAPAQDTLFVVAAANGAQLAAWPVPAASGVAFLTDGRLVVGSGTAIVALDTARGTPGERLADAGGEVWDVEPTADGGFVATVGEPRHQVVRFAADGREIRALGTPGGRPRTGPMQPESFRNPVGLCALADGRIFAAENAAPRRFTRWAPDGHLEKQFHGPYYFSGMFGVDEEEPELIYGDTHADLIRYRVDYDTGAWAVEHYWIGAYEQTGVPIKWWPRIRHRDGKTYWCSGSGAIAELAEDRARGVAAVYGGWIRTLDDGTLEPVYHNQDTGRKGTWSDLNGDGRKQPDEWQTTEAPAYPLKGSGPQQGWGAYFDEGFNLYMHDWTDDTSGGVWKIPVAEWRDGVPVYRWEQALHVGLPRLGLGLGHGAAGARTAFAHAGAVYAFNGGYNAADLPGVGHGHDWEFAQITKYDEASGRPLWHAGERAPSFLAPGQHYCPTGAAGIVGDYLFWTDENSLVHVWDTERGLYVATLLEDISRGPDPSPYTVWVELFNTRVFRHPKSGKVYLLAGSDAIHIFEVGGTERPPTRFSGEFTLTAEGLAAARAQADLRTPQTGRRIAVLRHRAAEPPSLDSPAFADAPAATFALRPDARGEARLLYDARALYVRFEVRDDSPWRNAGGDPTALFKSGDECSVWLGPTPGARTPAPGHLRVLLAPAAEPGKARAILYRIGPHDDARPADFRSPAGQVRIADVRENADVAATVSVAADAYRLIAVIPWSLLGVEPAAGRTLGLDLSVNFSDPAGQRNVARLHWGRNGAAIVYDLPSEARFEPALWGTAELVE